MRNKKLLGNALLLLTALVWGMAFVFQRDSAVSDIGPFTFCASRMALSALAVGTVSFALDAKRGWLVKENRARLADPERRRATITGGIASGVFLAFASASQQLGLKTTTAGKAGFITALYILIVPVLSLLVFRRRIGLQTWAAVFLGLAGMFLLCLGGGEGFGRGDLSVLLCAFIFSCQIMTIDRFAPQADPVKMAAVQFTVTTVITAAAALLFEDPSWAVIRENAVSLLYCGLMSGAVGYTLQDVAQRLTDPTSASLLMSLESVFSVIGGALLLHEAMLPREAAGCVIMFAAIILVQIPLRRRAETT